MWIETEKGTLFNLDRGSRICFQQQSNGKHVIMGVIDDLETGDVLATFKTEKARAKAMDRLKKWIASDGEDGLPEVTQEGNATIVSPNWTQVFSFRTLSEDDECKTQNP